MSFKGSQVVIKIMAYTQKKYQDHISYCFVYKVVCIDNKFTKRLFFTEEKVLFIGSLKQFWKSMIIVKKR